MSNAIDLPNDNTATARTIGTELTRYLPVFKKLLADTGISEETFAANIAQAYKATPKLDQCDVSSVLGAALRSAQLGLTPNDARSLAWVIPRGREATFQLGYGGIMELARRAVPGIKFDGRPVYPNDEFDIDYGANTLTHKPDLHDRGGPAYAWYVRATWPDGTVQIQMLDRAGVEYHKGFSKMGNAGMWKTSYDAAALKSCVIDLKRWLPASPQLAAAIAADGDTVRIEQVQPLPADMTEHAGNISHETDTPAALEAGAA